MTKITRLLILDPVPHGRRGHHQHFIEGVLRDRETLGVDAHFFVGKSDADSISTEPVFHPTFQHYLYKPLSSDPYNGALRDFQIGSQAFAADLHHVLKMRPSESDLLIVPSTSFRIAAGLARWRRETKCASPAVLLFHHLVPVHLSLQPGSLGGALARTTGEALAASKKDGEALLGATTEGLAKRLSTAMKMRVSELPLPLWYPASSQTEAECVGAPPVVAVVGGLRKEKGAELMPSIVADMEHLGIPARLSVQGNNPDPESLQPLMELQRAGRLDLLREELSDEEFGQVISKATFILFPYDRKRYLDRSSGAFSYAAALGRPCIVPSDTWMSQQIEAGNAAGLIYSGNTSSDIVCCVAAAISDVARLSELAAIRAGTWRAKQNGTAFLRSAIEWAENRTMARRQG
ncbi:MAG: hypothetical protein WD044_07395 [Dongiaceae bacterium]